MFDYDKSNKPNEKKDLSKQFQELIQSSNKNNKINQSDLVHNNQVLDDSRLNYLVDSGNSLSELKSKFLDSNSDLDVYIGCENDLGKLTWSSLKLFLDFKL